MRTVLTLCVLLSSILCSAQHSLTVRIDNISQYQDRQIGILVRDLTSSHEVIRYRQRSVTGNTYEHELWGLVTGHEYSVGVFIDVNNNLMYDEPPVDVAWQKSVTGVVGPMTVEFVSTDATADIAFPNKVAGTFDYVTKEYVGSWINHTYSTTGPATGNSVANYAQSSGTLSITTNGAFGIPGPMTINFEGAITPDGESIALSAQSPFTGSVALIEGFLTGEITVPSVGATLVLHGNYGEHQTMFTYTMSGAFTANGVMTLTESTATDVAEDGTQPQMPGSPLATRTSVWPNPTEGVMHVRSQQPFTSVVVLTLAGQQVYERNGPSSTATDVDLGALPAGVYVLSVRGSGGWTQQLVQLQ